MFVDVNNFYTIETVSKYKYSSFTHVNIDTVSLFTHGNINTVSLITLLNINMFCSHVNKSLSPHVNIHFTHVYIRTDCNT